MASSPAKNKISASSLFSSCSSPSTPSRPNPKPGTSGTGDLMRRRNSIGDKENQSDKDQILNAVKGSKGSKHFMSPTISAVSKINPSPKKRILSDKNGLSRSFDKTYHQVRSSVSFSDVISIIGDTKDQEQIFTDEKKQLEDSHDLTVTDIDENLENKSNDDSSFKVSPLPPCVPFTFPVFESHEVDPLVAPYDPKKNYLSPRPQFLHYKPIPRIEHHFDECRQLEELFVSESSSSDTDLSSEESQQEEEVASQEGVVAVEEEAEQIQVEDSGKLLEAAESDDKEEVVVVESFEEETHHTSKQSRFKTSKLLGLILALGVAYLLVVSLVTFTQPDIIKDSPFYQYHIPPETVKSTRESFEELSVKLVMWAESSFVYMDKLISSIRGEEEYGHFQFHNLTDLWEDRRLSDTVFQPNCDVINVYGLLADGQDWSLETDVEEDNGGLEEPENSCEISLEALYEEDGNEVEQESDRGEVNSIIVYEFIHQAEIKMTTDTEVSGGERVSLSEEVTVGQENDDVDGQREYEGNDQKNIGGGHESETRLAAQNESDAHQLDDVVESPAISGDQQEETEVANTKTVPEEEGTGEITGNSFDVSAEATDEEQDSNDIEEESGVGEVVNDAGSEEILLSHQRKVVLVSTLMVLLAAAAAGFLLAKKKATKSVVVQHNDGGEPTIISDTMPVENLIKERLSSLNFQEEEEVEDDRIRQVSPLPSEMSFSFHENKSFHSSSNRDDLKEYQSGGGGRKSNDSGESMASSASEYSIGSVSYGSFTTYEKIQKRSGHKEKAMITPVRRSSRIRNHQHSGQ